MDTPKTYSDVAKRLDNLYLLNTVPTVDPDIYDGLEHGSLYTPCDFELQGDTKYTCREHGADVDIAPEEWDNNDPLPECENKTDYAAEIYQWYLIGDDDARYLKEHTDELIFYSNVLEAYVWGITHFGTSWDGVEIDWTEEVQND